MSLEDDVKDQDTAGFPSPAPDVAALRKLARTSHNTEDHRRLYWAIDYVNPYPKALELFEWGRTKRERRFKAANQSGKSYHGAIEISYHLTGRYPSWWKGWRSSTAITAWVCSETSLTLRDTMQKLLFGEPGDPDAFGTGTVPLDLIGDRVVMARGNVSDAYDTVRVKHVSGKWSTCRFRPYRAGREAFQGVTLQFIVFDEEPPSDVYFEGLTRISATRGRSLVLFTPMAGPTEITRRFTDEVSPDREIVRMSLYDICNVPGSHMTPEMVEEIRRNTPPHMIRTRLFGEDMLGEGSIFPVDEASITEPPLTYVPDEWFKIWGIDFGIGHPFGAVLVLYHAEADIIHVHHCIRLNDQTPLQHAVPMKAIGADVVVAYPRDGDSRQMGSGEPLAELYRKEDLRLTSSPATFDDGTYSTDRGNLELWQRMTTGRFFVASTLGIWFEEFRSYHRKNNQIVKIHDDLISATRTALMMLRFAKQGPLGSKRPPLQNRMQGGIARGTNFGRGVGLILVGTSFAIAALAIGINAQTGARFGTSPLASVTFAGLSVAADTLAIVLPSAAVALWWISHRGLSALAWATWVAATTMATMASVGFASLHIGDTAASRAAVVYTSAAMMDQRTAAIDAAKAAAQAATAARVAECQKRGSKCRELEHAEQARMSELQSAIAAPVPTVPTITEADPQVAGAVRLASWAGLNLTATDVGNLRLALMGLLPNLAGLVLAFGVALRGAATRR